MVIVGEPPDSFKAKVRAAVLAEKQEGDGSGRRWKILDCFRNIRTNCCNKMRQLAVFVLHFSFHTLTMREEEKLDAEWKVQQAGCLDIRFDIMPSAKKGPCSGIEHCSPCQDLFLCFVQ